MLHFYLLALISAQTLLESLESFAQHTATAHCRAKITRTSLDLMIFSDL